MNWVYYLFSSLSFDQNNFSWWIFFSCKRDVYNRHRQFKSLRFSIWLYQCVHCTHTAWIQKPFGCYDEWIDMRAYIHTVPCMCVFCTWAEYAVCYRVWVGIRVALRRSNLKQKVTFTTPSTLRIAMHYTNKKRKSKIDIYTVQMYFVGVQFCLLHINTL